MNRVSVKRLLAMVLAVAMLVAMNASPVAVWAAELQKPEIPSASITKINPMYAHLDIPASNGVATASVEDVYEAANAQEAAAILQELLYSRADAVILQMPVDITYDETDEEAFWEALWMLEEEIYLAAVAHTGDPKEGDYLRYHTYMRDIEAGMWVEGTTMVELCYYFTYNATAEQEAAVDATVDALLDSWDLNGADDYEKVCMAYDWLCDNVVYSEDLSMEYGTIYSAYGALVDKDCVCQGYAAALYRLLLELGVDCRVVAGIGNGGPHAWNIIGLEDLYYNADATWDATYSQAGWEYQYFLKSEANFPDHYREMEFTTAAFYGAYPMGSEDYVYVPSVEEPVTSGTCGENATWNFEDGVLTVSGSGMMTNYDLETKAPWSEYAETITSVVVEEGITFVGKYAFAELPKLEEATISDSVSFIMEGAFLNCPALENVSLPAELDFLGEGAFRYCKSLNDLTIPYSATSIGKYAFSGCHAFTYLALPEDMTEIPEGLAEGCKNLTGVLIPNTIESIYDNAFMDCVSLKTVIIPASVTDVGSLAFANCSSLKRITFWGDAPTMDDTESLFAGVTATVYYPAGNETWTEDVMQQYGGTLTWVANTLVAAGFCGDNLTWTLDEDGLLTISGEGEMTDYPWKEEYAGSITAVVIEEGVTSICGLAFEFCTNLTSVSVSSTVTDMGGYTFGGCSSLETVNIPQGVTTLKEGIFQECESLTSVVIPESVTKIGKLAFHYAGLKSVVIPANVTEICEAAFYGCKALDEIVFTGDAPAFGDYVFRYVSAIAYYPYGNATWTEDVLQDYDGTLTWVYQDEDGAIHGDNGDGTAWVLSGDTLTLSGTGEMIRSTWSHFRNQIRHVVIQEGITSIGVIVFGNMFNLETVDIPSSVTRIREDAFSMDDCLQTVTIRGNGLETIESWAFYGCSALESLTLPDSVTEICPEAFTECMSLQTLTFQGNAPTIGENAFYGVTATVSYPGGDATWTEEVMQQYGGTLTWVAVWNLFELAGVSVLLGDSLDMYFVVSEENVDAGCYAVCTRSYADGREDHVVTLSYDQWEPVYGNLKAAVYTGIAAKEMGDEITVVIYNADGNPISEPWTDSVASYSLRMLRDEDIQEDAEIVTVFVDMLNYGAAAQTFFKYDTENLVNASLTEEQKACATGSYTLENNLVGGPGRAATSLTLKNRITLDLFFSNSVIGSDYSGLYAIASYTDHYGDAVQVRIEGSDFKAYSETVGYVSVPGLAVADYAQVVTCTVYDADGNVLAWTADSIEGYAYRMADQLPAIVEAIIKFGISAYNYFHD